MSRRGRFGRRIRQDPGMGGVIAPGLGVGVER